ncbi:MAG: hypothetical protein ACE5EL_02395, partial [Anaerolineae bacterium]
MYLAVAAGGALPFLGGYTRVFLADDWPLIGAARGLSFSNTALWLRPVPGTFYRPLFSLALAAGWRAFGTTTIAYHLTVWAAYVTVGALVGVAA